MKMGYFKLFMIGWDEIEETYWHNSQEPPDGRWGGWHSIPLGETPDLHSLQTAAYYRWLERGSPLWDDWTDWFEAEGDT